MRFVLLIARLLAALSHERFELIRCYGPLRTTILAQEVPTTWLRVERTHSRTPQHEVESKLRFIIGAAKLPFNLRHARMATPSLQLCINDAANIHFIKTTHALFSSPYLPPASSQTKLVMETCGEVLCPSKPQLATMALLAEPWGNTGFRGLRVHCVRPGI